jgi:hypothetical protein
LIFALTEGMELVIVSLLLFGCMSILSLKLYPLLFVIRKEGDALLLKSHTAFISLLLMLSSLIEGLTVTLGLILEELKLVGLLVSRGDHFVS